MRELCNREGTHIPSLLLPKRDLNCFFLRKSKKTSEIPEKSDMQNLTLLPELSSWTTSGPVFRSINLMECPSALRGRPGAAGRTLLSAQQPLCCYSRHCLSNEPNILLVLRFTQEKIQYLHIQTPISSVSVIPHDSKGN